MTKVKVRVANGKLKPKEEPTKQTKPVSKRKGLIRKFVHIVYQDIRYLPNRILGKPVVKEMASADTWEDWEGQL